jgi:hypothetical protein
MQRVCRIFKRILGSAWTSLTLLALLILVVSLEYWNIFPWKATVNTTKFGTWTDLLSSVGTIAAVIVALHSTEVGRRRIVEQLNRARDQELSRIYAWLTQHRSPSGSKHWYLSFENKTGLPIYEWHVDFTRERAHACSSANGPIRPNSTELLLPDFGEIPLEEMPKLVLTFVDSIGRPWRRNELGQLAQSNQKPDCTETHLPRRLGTVQREWNV